MTTIAYRDGVMVSDSRGTVTSKAGGARCQRFTKKLFRKTVDGKSVIIATAGETYAGLQFVEWYGARGVAPSHWMDYDDDFDILVLAEDGLFAFDPHGTAEKLDEPYWAIGSGAKAALGAMAAGATAEEAVRIACEIDPYSSGPLQIEVL